MCQISRREYWENREHGIILPVFFMFSFLFSLNYGQRWGLWSRVSSETSFASKQLKLEPKLVLALSETKRLFRLFHFFTETASFGVSIEPKQKIINRKTECRQLIVLISMSKLSIWNWKLKIRDCRQLCCL